MGARRIPLPDGRGSQVRGSQVRAEIVAAVDELVAALAGFADRMGRDVELTVDASGTLTVMVAEEFSVRGEASGYESAAVFESLESLWAYLEFGALEGD